MCLLDGYKKLGYIVFMDNFYIGSDLFHNWLINEKTAACGTMRPRRGVPKELTPTKFKQQVEYKVMSITIKWLEWVLNWKHVTLLSTAYGSRSANTGRKHWQTKEAISKPKIVYV